jgi:hypothetical protein
MELNTGRLPDRNDLFRRHAHQQHVALSQPTLPEGRPQVSAVAEPPDNPDLISFGILNLGGRLVEKGRVRQNPDLGKVLGQAKTLRRILNTGAGLEQEMADQ